MTEDEAIQRVAEYCKGMGKKPPVSPYCVFAKEGEAVTPGYDMWAVFPDGRDEPTPGIEYCPSCFFVNCETGEVAFHHG